MRIYIILFKIVHIVIVNDIIFILSDIRITCWFIRTFASIKGLYFSIIDNDPENTNSYFFLPYQDVRCVYQTGKLASLGKTGFYTFTQTRMCVLHVTALAPKPVDGMVRLYPKIDGATGQNSFFFHWFL